MKSSRRTFLITSIGVASTFALSRQAFADAPRSPRPTRPHKRSATRLTRAKSTRPSSRNTQRARTAATAASTKASRPTPTPAARCSRASRSRARVGAAHITRRPDSVLAAHTFSVAVSAPQHCGAGLRSDHRGVCRPARQAPFCCLKTACALFTLQCDRCGGHYFFLLAPGCTKHSRTLKHIYAETPSHATFFAGWRFEWHQRHGASTRAPSWRL